MVKIRNIKVIFFILHIQVDITFTIPKLIDGVHAHAKNTIFKILGGFQSPNLMTV